MAQRRYSEFPERKLEQAEGWKTGPVNEYRYGQKNGQGAYNTKGKSTPASDMQGVSNAKSVSFRVVKTDLKRAGKIKK